MWVCTCTQVQCECMYACTVHTCTVLWCNVQYCIYKYCTGTIPSHLLTWDHQVLQYWSTTVSVHIIINYSIVDVCTVHCIWISWTTFEYILLNSNMHVLYSNICCMLYVLYPNTYSNTVHTQYTFGYSTYSNAVYCRIQYILYSNTVHTGIIRSTYSNTVHTQYSTYIFEYSTYSNTVLHSNIQYTYIQLQLICARTVIVSC